jgi:hypothetical protein
MILSLKNNKVVLLALCLFFVFINCSIQAQCQGCTTTINNNSVSSYTAATNQTICVSSGITYTGNITLNGGTICNLGTINNITFLKGTFNNYGLYNKVTQTAGLTGTVNIHNYSGSTFSLGALTFSASNAAFIFQLNVYKGASAIFSGDVIHNSGVFNIEVGKNNPGGNSVNQATFYANRLFTTKSKFSLLVNASSTCTFNDIASLEGTGIKEVTNYGQLNFNNNLNMVSAGSSSSTVTINNYYRIAASQFVNAAYTNGKVFINNYAGTDNLFHIVKSISLSNTTNTLTNNGNFLVDENFNIIRGLAVNTGTIINNKLSSTGGTLTNNNYIKSNADLSVTNSSAVVNNNNTIDIARTFSNVAKINLAANSFLYTKNYYNSASTSSITGPSSTITIENYPRIFISDTSNNSGGYVSNKVIIYDASLTSTTANIGYGLDILSTSTRTRIASSVLFGSKAVSPGNGNAPTYSCSILNYFYKQLNYSSPEPPIIFGTAVQLNTYLYFTKHINVNTVYQTNPVASSNYTWQPGNLVGNYSIYQTPLSNKVYTASSSFAGCVFSNTLAVNLKLNALAALDHIKPDGVDDLGNITLNVGGGTAPYTYTWMPGNIHTKDLTNIAAGTYTVKVKDNVGDTIKYSYSLGYKTKWKSNKNTLRVSNDSIIGDYGEGVTKNTLRPGVDGWIEYSFNTSIIRNFLLGFTDSVSVLDADVNDFDFGVSTYYNTMSVYVNGAYNYIFHPFKSGDVMRIEKVGSVFNLSVNGNVVASSPADPNKYYKLKLINYVDVLTNVGTSFTDSTDLYFPNYVQAYPFINHSSGVDVNDGSITLAPKIIGENDTYTWLDNSLTANMISGLSKGTLQVEAKDDDNVRSNYSYNILYKANFSNLQGAIFRNDSLISVYPYTPSGYSMGTSLNVLKSSDDGEISYRVQKNLPAQYTGFVDTVSIVAGDANDIDHGIYDNPIDSVTHVLYYIYNGNYVFLGYTRAYDILSIKRTGPSIDIYKNGIAVYSRIIDSPTVDWYAKVGISGGYGTGNIGVSLPNPPLSISSAINNIHYAILNRNLNSGYYNSINTGSSNTFYFTFLEEYFDPVNGNLDFKIIDDNENTITSLPSMVQNIGDNRFSLNVSTLVSGAYYKIFVYNNNKEVWKGRIRIN